MKKTLPTTFLSVICLILSAQDMQYSQYYANSLYLNPAFTGAIMGHRVSLNHRLQWPELPKAFASYSASYDYNAVNLNSGFGLLVNSDRAGVGNLKNTSAAFNYSYRVSVEDKWVFKPAVSFGYTVRSVDYSSLIFGDQIDFDFDGAPTQDPIVANIDNNDFFEFGSGLLAYNRQFWLGMSAFHLNQPNNSLLDGTSQLPMKITVHGGIKVPLGNPDFKDIKKGSLSPSFLYKMQGDFKQLDIGTSFHYQPIIFGLYYRGLPIANVVPNQLNHDAVIVVFGVEFQNFQFGYSFDNNVSRLSTASGGAHEISLIYQFVPVRNPHRVKHSQKYLPCPAFVDNLNH